MCNHGRQSKEVLAREKQMSGFHLYPTLTTAEICCITLKESMISGSIPILSDKNIFGMFEGIHIKHDAEMSVEDYYRRVALGVIDILQMPDEKLEELSNMVKQSKLLKSWGEVSMLWLKEMDFPDFYGEYEKLVEMKVLP